MPPTHKVQSELVKKKKIRCVGRTSGGTICFSFYFIFYSTRGTEGVKRSALFSVHREGRDKVRGRRRRRDAMEKGMEQGEEQGM